MSLKFVRLTTVGGDEVAVVPAHVVMLRAGDDMTCGATTNVHFGEWSVLVRGTAGEVAALLVGVPPAKPEEPPYQTTVYPGAGVPPTQVKVCGPCKRPLDCYEFGKCARGSQHFSVKH